jgi:hypothetical protein
MAAQFYIGRADVYGREIRDKSRQLSQEVL